MHGSATRRRRTDDYGIVQLCNIGIIHCCGSGNVANVKMLPLPISISNCRAAGG